MMHKMITRKGTTITYNLKKIMIYQLVNYPQTLNSWFFHLFIMIRTKEDPGFEIRGSKYKRKKKKKKKKPFL